MFLARQIYMPLVIVEIVDRVGLLELGLSETQKQSLDSKGSCYNWLGKTCRYLRTKILSIGLFPGEPVH
jgi:hypothetical protein